MPVLPTMHIRQTWRLILVAVLVTGAGCAPAAEHWRLWGADTAPWQCVLPEGDAITGRLAHSTLTNYLADFYGATVGTAGDIESNGTYLVVGTPKNNRVLASLVRSGLRLASAELGTEGFELVTHQDRSARFIIAHAPTPRAAKHACQELLFYRVRATASRGWLEPPLQVTAKPQIRYRGVYMLPCWSAYDSLDSWKRVLRFNSELTLNRHWFWLDGFPVAGHRGEYGASGLASAAHVQTLLDLAAAEATHIYIGGGWFNWHHEKAMGKDYKKGVEYYLSYLRAFSNFHGFYIEPTGEGSEIKNWRPECDALRELIRTVMRTRPEFEFAIAIGKFNNPEYLKLMSEMDPARVYWWWCWGDPLRDQALDLYPSVLRWHINQKMADYHGSRAPPQPAERALAGVVTSYDPGQGFGNPWNGWGKLGVDKPRNFHPHTIPYFAEQYLFRERCWNLELTQAEFLARLHARLFDDGTSHHAVEHYWQLSLMAYDAVSKKYPAPEQLRPLMNSVSQLQSADCSPKMKNTLSRMTEALDGLAKLAGPRHE